MEQQPSCKQRWRSAKDGVCSELRKLWRRYQNGTDENGFHEYGLCFDYVAPGTFKDQREGYWCYQISYGGPTEEFRFYSSSATDEPYRISFTFLDWFDGCERALTGRDLELLNEIWDFFSEIGSTQAQQDKARVTA